MIDTFGALFLLFSFCVTSSGRHVFLPGGAELIFPPGCLSKTRRLEWVENTPEKKLVHLEEHEILLSCPLELRPHGINFLKVFTEAFNNYKELYNNLTVIFVHYYISSLVYCIMLFVKLSCDS